MRERLAPGGFRGGPRRKAPFVRLSVQNYLKGGNVENARANLESFKEAFPDVDLYYPDGSSFIETMEALLGQKDLRSFGRLAVLNVNSELKGEFRRIRHWKRN